MVRYIGRKYTMAEWISSYIPNNIKTYVEVFGGAYWTYLNSDIYSRPALENIIYNDYNRYMVNLFECCRTPQEFYEHMLDVKSQIEELYDEFKKEIFVTQDISQITLGDFDFAMKYAYIITQGWSGHNPEKQKFIDLRGKYESLFEAFRKRLRKPSYIRKLKMIDVCENLNYSDVIEKYDSSTTFFYCDPPYWQREDFYSLHEFDRDDHEKLCKQLKGIEGDFALSYYDFELLNKWLPEEEYNWQRKGFVVSAGAAENVILRTSEELLIMNYNIGDYNLGRFFT